MRKAVTVLLASAYLVVMAYFAFRPFEPIYGLQYAPADLEFDGAAVHVRRDASLEGWRDVKRVRSALIKSDQMSLNIILQTDSLRQVSSHVFGLTRDGLNKNFALDQDGNMFKFRLYTISGLQTALLAPRALDPGHRQNVLITYDGMLTRLYIDGALRGESTELQGGFGNWGYNHVLTVGDHLPGGDGWNGRIWRIAIYDRALDPAEAGQLARNELVDGAVATYDFGAVSSSAKNLPGGFRPMHYRNLFITTDSTAYDLGDCLFNIAGFVPLGMLVYILLPPRLERRKMLAVITMPLLVGLLVGGTIEFLQQYIYTRVPCAPDLIYNMTGSLLGGLMGWLSFSKFRDKRLDGSET